MSDEIPDDGGPAAGGPAAETVLAGGNMNAVVRQGDTVLRTAGPWTPTVHRHLSYLALAGVVNLVLYVPLLVLVFAAGLTGLEGIAWLWAAFAVGYMLARALTLGWRVRNDRWMVTGAATGTARFDLWPGRPWP